jgi:nucleoside phosphorylase
MSRIVIVAAVEAELTPFLSRHGIVPGEWCAVGRHLVRVSFTGVGPVVAAFHIQRLIGTDKPERIIQAGICGAYDGSTLEIGQIVQVIRQRPADLGAVRQGRFHHIFPENRAIVNPYPLPGDYPQVAGFTVGTAGTPLAGELQAVFADDRAAVESMEGYSLFYVCERYGIPFAELRAVSNRVWDERSRWDIPLATARLAEALTEILARP